MTDPVVIVAAKRSPLTKLQGQLATLSAPQIAAPLLADLLQTTALSSKAISEVIMGCVLSAGQGQAPARQASIFAGIDKHVGATTINKMCGSGMKSVMLACNQLMAGDGSLYIAGGMENMSQAPYLLKQARSGYRLGHDKLYDHMFLDGLEDAYQKGCLMGYFAEETAKTLHISREEQDAFAIASLTRAQEAQAQGAFKEEILPYTLENKQGSYTVTADENPQTAKVEKIPQLKPAFQENGSVTAANSSSISDGAAALLLMRRSQAIEHGLKPLARIVGYTQFAQEPAWFTTAPAVAIDHLLKKIAWEKDSVDLFEINEAFAVVTLACAKTLHLPLEKINVHGGACAIGHPIGASGARIIVTLLHALKRRQEKRGIAALCIGGGEATAIAIEIE